jgi:CRISPR-associated protein Csh1
MDVTTIILFRIDKDIVNKKIDTNKIRDFLKFYMNNHILEGMKMNEKSIILEKIKDMRSILVNPNIEDLKKFKIRDKEEWAYWAGQAAYYLVNKSKTSEKTFGLLEPFTNKSTTDLVKFTLKELFEKYKHAINLADLKFKTIFSNTLDYPVKDSFLDLKMLFYIGVFDNNVMFEKHFKEVE